MAAARERGMLPLLAGCTSVSWLLCFIVNVSLGVVCALKVGSCLGPLILLLYYP